MNPKKIMAWGLMLMMGTALFTLLPVMADETKFRDVLDTPATLTPLAQKTLLQTVIKQGNRLIAVGQRGHLLISSDQGQTWVQQPLLISGDLLSVAAPDENNIWVSGHDGVVLYSADAGKTWTLQLDGKKANAIMASDLSAKLAQDPSNVRLQKLAEEAQFYQQEGATKPLTGIWFADAQTGIAVGAYGLIFVTQDGGKSWQSWFDVIDNPKFYHFNAVTGCGDEAYLTGEGGNVWQVNLKTRASSNLKTPYEGSFFDIAVSEQQMVVGGMRGNVWHKPLQDGNWEKSQLAVNAGITHVLMQDGAIFLTTQNAKVLVSQDGGKTFAVLATKAPMVYAGMALIEADPQSWSAALVGLNGVRLEKLVK